MLTCCRADAPSPLRSRMLNWHISLFLLLCTILLLVPISFSLALTLRPGMLHFLLTSYVLLNVVLIFGRTDISIRTHPRSVIFRMSIASLPVALFVYILSYIPLPVALSSYNPWSSIICRLVVLGTTILGLLSGFGALSASWNVLSGKAFVILLSCDGRCH